ncbi:hydroxymethylbilane synthase [Streptomyces ipomoeae]|uniref:hydroxymethylbilane synthase n=1 Tax=Streptomyces ipomoeae TaxID=103232 RepID=UPI0029BDC121|nr:hydroxymethylbilane synthase [Streptomyces ipomoeae]MDX2820582.1 hydroxymethylbilane synthase [Streptomyces ipomoeae]MDX2873061.1 hydroxymethylbilane synthase [Streptomyces ipomoeae]
MTYIPPRLVIGTRDSDLAKVQAAHVAGLLERAFPQVAVHLSPMKAAGDLHQGPLSQIGGKAVWVRELDRALATARVDVTVSCAKDLPGPHERGTDTVIGTVLPREDARDALVLPAGRPAATLDDLPPGSVVGTSAPRRIAQLRARYPHLTIEPVRGNLVPRLARLDSGEGDKPLDALVVAYAGLCRVSRADRATQLIPPSVLAPATGAGTLVVEQRSGDTIAAHLLNAINDTATARLLAVERGVLAQLKGNCQTACSVHAHYTDRPNQIGVDASIFHPSGDDAIHVAATGPADDPGGLVENITQLLRGEGVERLLPR